MVEPTKKKPVGKTIPTSANYDPSEFPPIIENEAPKEIIHEEIISIDPQMVSKLEPILTSEELTELNETIGASSQRLAKMFGFEIELIELYKEYLKI